MLKVAGITLIGVIVILLLKKNEPSVGIIIALSSAVLLFFSLSEALNDLGGFLTDITAASGVGTTYIYIPLKALGLSIITQLVADTARDAGASALANQTEFAGRALILYTALPLLKALLQIITELVRNT